MDTSSTRHGTSERRAFSPDDPFVPESFVPRLPDDASTRGMLFHTLSDALIRGGCPVPDGKFIAFKRYPLHRYHAYILECAALYCPDAPLAQGVYELGLSVYPAFANSLVGKAIFTVAGYDLERLVQLAPRAYDVVNSYGRCVVYATTPTSAHWRLEGVWDYLPFSIGISEGAALACGIKGFRMEYVAYDVHDVELWATWDAKG